MCSDKKYDLAIIGGGPAGYSAALYAARANLDVIVFEQGMPGGQIATTDIIDNYPGIPNISGSGLGDAMRSHAEDAGAHAEYAMVTKILEHGGFTIDTSAGPFESRALIMATGATPRPGGFDREDEYRGRGISYCATCDGMFYRGKQVFVIGGGNSAVEEALYLSKIADQVTMVVRRDKFRASPGDGMFYRGKQVFVIGGGNSAVEEALYLSKIADQVTMVVRRDKFRASPGLVSKLMEAGNISIRFNTSIVAVSGNQLLTSITFNDNISNDRHIEEMPEGSFGIFVFTGMNPVTDLVDGMVEFGIDGGVLTDENMATKTPGLYCAGDMRSKSLRQVITAASDGAIAAMSAYRYLDQSA